MRWDFRFLYAIFYSTIIDFFFETAVVPVPGYSNTELRMMHVSTRTRGLHRRVYRDRGLGGVLSELAGRLSGLRS